jgi:uncharacterized protein YhfF
MTQDSSNQGSEMQVNVTACKTIWVEYLRGLPPSHAHHRVKPDTFAFGDSKKLADELAQLVVAGKKTATASLAVEFTSVNEPLPRTGDVSIVLCGDGDPVAIIECTDLKTVPFQSVDEAFAATEGEGDMSLTYWREVHAEYFTRVCKRLGETFAPTTPVLCQTFRLLWCVPSPRA